MEGIPKQTKEAILERMKEWKNQYCNSDEYNDAREDCYVELKRILNSLPEIDKEIAKRLWEEWFAECVELVSISNYNIHFDMKSATDGMFPDWLDREVEEDIKKSN